MAEIIARRHWQGFDPWTPPRASEPSDRTSKTYHRIASKAWPNEANAAEWCGLNGCRLIAGSNCADMAVMPIGCSMPSCLQCADRRTGEKVRKLSRLLFSIADALDFRSVMGRAVFTVDPEWKEFASSREGSKKLARDAVGTLAQVLAVDRRDLAAWPTYHPTSSKQPYKSHPHVEVHWLHASLNPAGANALDWWDRPSGRLIDSALLSWTWKRTRYGGTAPPHVDYLNSHKTDSVIGRIRYGIRPFFEDVWHAIDKNSLPPLHESETLIEGLAREGGVRLWKYYARYQGHGFLASNGRKKRLETLGVHIAPDGPSPCPFCDHEGCHAIAGDRFHSFESSDVSGLPIVRFTSGKPKQKQRTASDLARPSKLGGDGCEEVARPRRGGPVTACVEQIGGTL